MSWKSWGAAVVGLAIGFTAAASIYNLLDAKKRSWAKRSAADCHSISLALEAFRRDHGHYPPLTGNIDDLAPHLTPKYLQTLPRRDTAGQPFLVVMNGSRAMVVSIGSRGAAVAGGEVVAGGRW